MVNLARLVFTLTILCFSAFVFGQRVVGVVKDVKNRLPISDAQVITLKATILTDKNGEFTLENVRSGDRLAIRIMGYETTESIIYKLTDTLRLYLKEDAIALQEVMIKGKRNYKLDSLSLRKEYARAFEYKGPGFSDMFIEKGNLKDEYVPSFTNPRSTASMVSLNLVQVASFFGKKKAQKAKLKKTLLRDEEFNYVDHVFSNENVKSITGLEGEELVKFMNQYRPPILTLKKMTGYELNLYIKKSFEEYV
ncbi:MAG: hypothetical protein EOO07_14095, partial [Chitinophagaceae bacterium]